MKIGYLGGSITAQQGWRPKTLAWFKEQFREAKFSEINAAIGGTGSDLGVFRLQQDVLDQSPDLLFVEFAVNDGGAPPEQIHRCMEGIVRQTWRKLPSCDICFVYTLTEALAPPMLEGKFPALRQRHGGTSPITTRSPASTWPWKSPPSPRRANSCGRLHCPRPMRKRKRWETKVAFAPDSVHPHVETGHELYLQAIVRSVPAINAASTKPGPHPLAEPFIATHFEAAKLIPISKAKLSAGFSKLDPVNDPFGKRWANRLSDLHRATAPGETLEFKFKGTRCSIYDIVGPDCGQVTITLDDQPARIVPRFDSYSTYHRLSALVIGTDLTDTVHSVKIQIHPDQPDKAKILSQRNEKIDKPERFNGNPLLSRCPADGGGLGGGVSNRVLQMLYDA